jgi:toxin ParE1/3/4
MGKVTWTAEAERWLRDIHDYIAQDNPTAAQRTVLGIAAKAKLLASFPEIGYLYEDRKDRHIRILLYGHYRIAYLVHESGDIDVLGVFHGALDIARHFVPGEGNKPTQS